MDYEEMQLLIRNPYLAYKPKDTRVVMYYLARRAPRRDLSEITKKDVIVVMNAKQARYHCTKQFGQILEENAAGDYLFLRVARKTK